MKGFTVVFSPNAISTVKQATKAGIAREFTVVFETLAILTVK